MRRTIIKNNKIIPNSLKFLIFKTNTSPYKELNDQYKAIYIHIPKNAGNTVVKAIFEGNKVGHKLILDFKAHDQIKFSQYFKFTLVRNPYERILSAFLFFKNGGLNTKDQYWDQKKLSQFNTFEDFVLALKSDSFANKIMLKNHFLPQTDYITDENNNLALDYIGKVETIENDIKKIATKLGISNVKLPHTNKSPREHHFYYNQHLREIVKYRYQKDFDTLNYKY